MTRHRAYIGMGSNLGDRKRTLDDAFSALSQMPQTILVARSSIYATEPIDPNGEQQDYYNAVAAVDTALEPDALLSEMHSIEQQAGRTREAGVRNTARTLDLDLLVYDDRRIVETGLQVPHPRIADRAFVLVPLAEIAPDCEIPGLGRAGSLVDRVANQRIARVAGYESPPADAGAYASAGRRSPPPARDG
jgi:2-amino-4-hydroxy-6-hydroxymethyldihydropteridine diphosphokinase